MTKFSLGQNAIHQLLIGVFIFLFFFGGYDYKVNAQVVSIQASGATTFCEGGSVTLSAITQSDATAQNPGGGSATGDCNCPPGYVVVGIQGRTGSWVDQYSLICQQLSSSGTLVGPTVITTTNGTSTGGSPAGPFMLPAGRVMVGGVIKWYQESSGFLGWIKTNYLLSIGLRGQTPAYVLAQNNNSTSPSVATDLAGSQSVDGTSTTWVPNGSVVTGMRSFNLDTYSSGVQWIYTPIKQVMTDYVWTPGGQTTKSITVTTSGTYTLTATSGQLSGSDSRTVTVNTIPAQPSSFSESAEYACKNTNFTYSTPAVAGATSYVWSYSGASGATFTNGTTNSVIARFANTNTNNSGTMSVSARNACGTSAALTIPVTVSTAIPSATANSLTGQSPVCQGASANYSVGATTGATYYVWNFSGSNVSFNGNGTTAVADFANNATGGNVTVTAANGCGNSATTRTRAVAITALPNQPATFSTSTVSLCQGSSGISYIVPTTTGATSYSWSYSGTGASINNSATRSVTIDYAPNATSGILSVSGVGTCGTGTPRTIAITLNNLPLISQIPTANLLSHYKLNGNADDAIGNNPGTLQNAPAPAADRFGNANKAYSFNGTNQYISTAVAYNNPNNFTMSLWFKTSSTNGGKLIGLGNNQTGSSDSYDRHIYLSNSGQLYFGVYPGGVRTIHSSSSYNDGNWHMATISLSSNGMKLYADGILVASDAATVTAENYTGYLKIGYDNTAGWTNQPNNFYFNGSLDDIIIYSSELSAAEVATLYNSQDGAGNNGPVCAGTTLSLSATALSGATYAWTGPNGFVSTSPNPAFTYTSATTGTYTLNVTQNGCTSIAYTNAAPKTSEKGKWVGSMNASWTNINNWCDAAVPTAATDVIITSGSANMPVVSGNAYANNLTINNGATLYNSASGIINLSGNFNNNGTFTDNGIYTDPGKVMFIGSSNQSINGSTSFNNVTINNNQGVTLNSASTVNGILTLTAGTFTTNNNLHQNLYTGAIAGTGSGTTTGNIRFFKTIWGDGYHYLSSPISGSTVSEWNDNVTMKFGPSAFNLYTYNETVPDTNKLVGWTAVTSNATTLQNMTGYALYFPRWIYNTLLDMNGSYTHGATFSKNLTNTPSTTPFNKPASDGWNLVGNPYPSTIDWKAATGWTKTNINDAIYTWDGRTGKYTSFVNNIGSNGGSRYIGSMQGFFVKVSGGSTGTLAMTNAVRTTSTLYDVWRTSESEYGDIFRLTAASGEYNDETVIRFKSDATTEFDNQLDAYKLLNGGSSPSLFSHSGDVDYSINSLPNHVVEKTIPLSIVTGFAGRYTFTADFSQFAGEQHILLEDRVMGTVQNLREDQVYTVNLDKGTIEGRFFIQYRNPAMETVTGNKGQYASTGIEISSYLQKVSVLFPNQSGKASIAVLDASGKSVYEQLDADISSGNIELLLPVPAGIYIVRVGTASGSTSQQVYLTK